MSGFAFGWTHEQIAIAKQRLSFDAPPTSASLMQLREEWDAQPCGWIQPGEVPLIIDGPDAKDKAWSAIAFADCMRRSCLS